MDSLSKKQPGYIIPIPNGYELMPEQIRPKYLLKRIGEDDIELSLEERNAVCHAWASGVDVIFVKGVGIAKFSIKSVEPKWGLDNVPPRPTVKYRVEIFDGRARVVEDQDDLELLSKWRQCYDKK